MKITPELLKINHENHMKMLNAIFRFWFRIATNAGGTIKPASAAGKNFDKDFPTEMQFEHKCNVHGLRCRN